MHPILYSFRRCPFAIRARLALKVSEHCCELREVVLRDKPEAMLQISPKGTVPVLVDIDGTVIDESLDIMLWALKQNDPLRWLDSESGSIDEMTELISQTDGEFKFHLDRYKYSNHYQGADAEVHRDLAANFLFQLNTRLNQTPFLFGTNPTLADIAIFPFVRQFANTDRIWFDSQTWHKLKDWLGYFRESEIFLSVMKKHRQWRPEDPLAYFP